MLKKAQRWLLHQGRVSERTKLHKQLIVQGMALPDKYLAANDPLRG
ncbi:hypothetical protein [Spirosoma pulveris]